MSYLWCFGNWEYYRIFVMKNLELKLRRIEYFSKKFELLNEITLKTSDCLFCKSPQIKLLSRCVFKHENIILVVY